MQCPASAGPVDKRGCHARRLAEARSAQADGLVIVEMDIQLDIWLRGDSHATTEVIAPVDRDRANVDRSADGSCLATACSGRSTGRGTARPSPTGPVAASRFPARIVSPFESGGVVIALEDVARRGGCRAVRRQRGRSLSSADRAGRAGRRPDSSPGSRAAIPLKATLTC